MRVDVFGLYQLEVRRTTGEWVVERLDPGKRRPAPDIFIPSHVGEKEIIPYLADLLHEYAQPERAIREVHESGQPPLGIRP